MKKAILKLSLFCFLFLLSGCARNKHLCVHTQYFGPKDLASYYVDTPDPCFNEPPVGQRLIISWSLKNKFWQVTNLNLKIRMRFRNGEPVTETLCLHNPTGTYIYDLCGNKFWERGNIQTFKVSLIGDDCVIEEFRHHLWNERINFDSL